MIGLSLTKWVHAALLTGSRMSGKTQVDKHNACVVGASQETQLLRLKEWTGQLQWQPACFSVVMIKLMYGLLLCAEPPQSPCQVMNSINTVGYWRRPGLIKSHLNFFFFIFSILHFWQISNKLHSFPQHSSPASSWFFLFCPCRPSLSINIFWPALWNF